MVSVVEDVSRRNGRALKGNRLLLFLPIETKAREMDAKILLACVSAERGHAAVVGDMREITRFAEFLPRGVYISKSIPEKVEREFIRLKSLGYGVTSWCEEGLVFRSRADYKREKVSEAALKHLDLFFAWGENQACAISEKAPHVTEKIRQVGNPRTDLIRPPYKEIYREAADRLRAKYGNYILFNTNFSIANNILGTQQAFLDFKKRGKVKTSQDEENYWNFHDHKLALLGQMKNLVKTVGQSYPNRHIVVRPHPSENHETWKDFVEPFDNVEVVFEGSAIPWLMSADVLIHNGCTTAIEAYYLETPAIAYRPIIKQGYELELPNAVSREATSADDVLELIQSISSGQDDYARWRETVAGTLKKHMADMETGWASDRVVEELEAFYAEKPLTPEFVLYRWMRWAKRRSIDALRTVKHGVTGRKPKTASLGEKHRRQKLPDLTAREIELLIEQLKQASGRFEKVAVKPIRRTERCFVIEKCG